MKKLPPPADNEEGKRQGKMRDAYQEMVLALRESQSRAIGALSKRGIATQPGWMVAAAAAHLDYTIDTAVEGMVQMGLTEDPTQMRMKFLNIALNQLDKKLIELESAAQAIAEAEDITGQPPETE